jgi:hypothetical protein
MKNEAKLFRSDSGSTVVLSEDPNGDIRLFVRPEEGDVFTRLTCSKDSPDSLWATDSEGNASGKLKLLGMSVVCWNGVRHTKQEGVISPEIIIELFGASPSEYLCVAEDGTLLYARATDATPFCRDFRLFVGSGSDMQEVDVLAVHRSNDFRTTFVQTVKGSFVSPWSLKTETGPVYGSSWMSRHEMVNLDPEKYEVVMAKDGSILSITEKLTVGVSS